MVVRLMSLALAINAFARIDPVLKAIPRGHGRRC